MKHFKRKSVWFVLLASVIFVQPLAAQCTQQYAEKLKVFEEFAKRQMAADGIPGLSIGFMNRVSKIPPPLTEVSVQ